MSTDSVTHTSRLTDLEVLHRWVERQLTKGRRDLPLDEAWQEFGEYFEQLLRCRAEIQVALDQSERGEARDGREVLAEIKEQMEARWNREQRAG